MLHRPRKVGSGLSAYLDEHPDQVERWHRIFRSRTARLKVPTGALQRATRHEQDPFRVAQTILRDARNHGEAFALSQAAVPFLLAPSDRQFLKVLADAPPSDYHQAAISVSSRRVSKKQTMADLAAQLLEVLHHLEIRARNRAEPRSLDKFLRGEDHQLLVAWIAGICERLKRTDSRTIDNEIIDELRDNLGRAEFENPLRDLLTHPAATFAGIVGFATTSAGSCIQKIQLPSPELPHLHFCLAPGSSGSSALFRHRSQGFNGPSYIPTAMRRKSEISPQ